MKIIYLLSLFFINLFFVNGQKIPQVGETTSLTKYDISDFPKSPEAAAFSKYIDIPATTHTGVLNISIPIYNFDFDGQNFPISLEYNTSGIKLDEIASRVGLGWTLNIGGVSLSQQVMGAPDSPMSGKADISKGFNPNGHPEVGSDTETALIALGYFQGEYPHDLQPDIFNYSTLNNSGKFIFDYKDTSKGLTIPSTDIIISRPGQFEINITDNKGFKYLFNNHKNLVDYNTCTNSLSFFNGYATDDYRIGAIISPNDKKILFEYGDVISKRYGTSSNQKRFLSAQSNNLKLPFFNDCYNFSEGRDYLLTEIEFEKGFIELIYGNDFRKDLDGDKYISSILIKNKQGQILKNFKLDLGKDNTGYFVSEGDYVIRDNRYEIGNNYRLRLNGITDEISGEKYSFQYYAGNLPPRLKNSKDYWGVYNGATNFSSIGSFEYYNWQANQNIFYNSMNNLNPNLDFGKIGNLQKVIFPTRGSQEIIYENDDFFLPSEYTQYYNTLGIIENEIGKTGTLRVAKVILDDNKGEKIIKRFTYIDPKTNKTSGRNYGPINLNFVKTDVVTTTADMDARNRYYNYATNNPGWQLTTINGKSIGYSHVQEVVENYKEPSKNYKTVYEYFYDEESYEADWTRYSESSLVNLSYPIYNPERGLLRKKEYYNHENKLIKKDSLIYNFDPFFNNKSSIKYNQRMLFVGSEIAVNRTRCIYGQCVYEFDWYNFQIRTYWIQNKKTISTDYFPNGNVVTTTENIYNPSYKHLYPINTITQTSKGETLTTEYQYPPDWAGNAIADKLTAQNRISEPLTIVQKLNENTVISAVYNEYKEFNGANGIIEKSGVFQKNGSSQFVEADRKITYNSYDTKGNLLQYTLENGIPVAIIWGYGGQYPVAKIEGSTFANATSKLANYLTKIQNGTLTVAEQSTIRTLIPDAMITTYTYKPLIGVTSITGPNGQSEFYNYDSSNRLQSIVNEKNEVIKTFEYNYKQP